MEKTELSRRTLLKGGGGALAGMTMMQATATMPAFERYSEEVIPWLDQPPPPPPSDANDNLQVWEKLDSWLTPVERFFNVNHYGQPGPLDDSTWRVGITGLVARPLSLTLADLKGRERREVNFTLECSGNHGFDWVSSAVGNARWAGTPLSSLLEDAGVLQQASEAVFYGLDRGPVTIRDNVGILSAGRTGTVEPDTDGGLDLKITEQFARSMSLREALHRDNLICYEMNGEPLRAEHGFPVRLIAPGWYGVANVKWLTRIEVLDHRYAGRFMARDYVSIREEERDGKTVWTFTTVGRVRLKSAPARVARRSGQYIIVGAAWGAPIAAVQVQIDDGPWLETRFENSLQTAVAEVQSNEASTAGESDHWLSPRKTSRGYGWRFWTFHWGSPTPGEHRIRSRAFDIEGNVQPAPEDLSLASRRTYWENNGQITRRVLIQ